MCLLVHPLPHLLTRMRRAQAGHGNLWRPRGSQHCWAGVPAVWPQLCADLCTVNCACSCSPDAHLLCKILQDYPTSLRTCNNTGPRRVMSNIESADCVSFNCQSAHLLATASSCIPLLACCLCSSRIHASAGSPCIVTLPGTQHVMLRVGCMLLLRRSLAPTTPRPGLQKVRASHEWFQVHVYPDKTHPL